MPKHSLFETLGFDGKTALAMNIVEPPQSERKYLVFIYSHGGSLLYGGANLPIFDRVNIVSQNITIRKPTVAVTFNYRIGLGRFLAGSAIKGELAGGGREGCANLVHRYISCFGGNEDNVTATRESAGGISISHQLTARIQLEFKRAICMSGHSNLLHFIKDDAVVKPIFELYDIFLDIPHEILYDRFEHICSYSIFNIPNYIHYRNSLLWLAGKGITFHLSFRSTFSIQ